MILVKSVAIFRCKALRHTAALSSNVSKQQLNTRHTEVRRLIGNARTRLLHLQRILLEETDDQHRLSARELLSRLAACGIVIERKTLYSDIEALVTYGMDIHHNKREAGYYVGERLFELAELKLLVDAVQSSKFITQSKSQRLVKKLGSHASIYQARELSRQVFIAGRVKSQNEQIYYNVDILHSAIAQNRQITFGYRDYGLDKKLHLRRGGESYTVSPYLLCWEVEHYYLVAWHDRYDGIAHFRVDKMHKIQVTEQPCHQLAKKIDAAEYAKRTFWMFSGELKRLEMEFDDSLIGVVIDRFGKEVSIHASEGDRFIASVNVALSPSFFAWIVQFGGKARILSPESVREDMQKLCKEVIGQYE